MELPPLPPMPEILTSQSLLGWSIRIIEAARAPLEAEIERLKQNHDRWLSEATRESANVRHWQDRAEAAERDFAALKQFFDENPSSIGSKLMQAERERDEARASAERKESAYQARSSELKKAYKERDELKARLEAIQAIVSEQAEDDGLWFVDAHTAPEAYLQQELRRLHAVIERRPE